MKGFLDWFVLFLVWFGSRMDARINISKVLGHKNLIDSESLAPLSRYMDLEPCLSKWWILFFDIIIWGGSWRYDPPVYVVGISCERVL